MTCPQCSAETRVPKTLNFGTSVTRMRSCAACGFQGKTEEVWLLATVGSRGQSPVVAGNLPRLLIADGGVGGVLPSGTGSGSDPDPKSDPDQVEPRAIPQGPDLPPRAPRRPLDTFGAATSAAFSRVLAAYPRKHAHLRAAVVFQELAATYPGGEEALAAAVLAAFPTMLRRPPYNSPEERFRPTLETVLAERQWEAPPPSSAPPPREPTPPPPAWMTEPPPAPLTPEQLAEVSQMRRAARPPAPPPKKITIVLEPAEPKSANGGT